LFELVRTWVFHPVFLELQPEVGWLGQLLPLALLLGLQSSSVELLDSFVAVGVSGVASAAAQNALAPGDNGIGVELEHEGFVLQRVLPVPCVLHRSLLGT